MAFVEQQYHNLTRAEEEITAYCATTSKKVANMIDATELTTYQVKIPATNYTDTLLLLKVMKDTLPWLTNGVIDGPTEDIKVTSACNGKVTSSVGFSLDADHRMKNISGNLVFKSR